MNKPKVALLINVVPPHRVAVFERMAAALNLIILHGSMESNQINRGSVKEEAVEGARVQEVSGWQFLLNKGLRRNPIDKWFLHLEPGYISTLIRERPDAVITYEMGFRTLVALAYGTCFRKPVWVWWGGTTHTEAGAGRVRKLLRGLISRWAQRWISYGQTSTEYLLTLGIPRIRILQVQNCVDETRYGFSAEPAFDVQPRPALLYVGQLIPRKGVAEFLRAAARLQQEGLVFSTVLVGGGCDSAMLQHLAASLGLRHIHFHPARPPKDIPSVYRSGDVLIFPTMQDVWGLVANEAVLSGLRVLCSRYAGCAPELFDPECIFDPADDEQFVAGLRRAVTGQLPPADPSRLMPSSEIGKVIADSVLAACADGPPREAGAMAKKVSIARNKN